ncbi:MAG: alpha/beta hydrolase [Gemmatimonadales bacterium]
MSTADPLPLHVETSGLDQAADVETYLLIHGYGASSYSWRHWVPALGTRGHVVTVDLKGCGRAPKPADGRYGPEHQAELIRALIERRDLRRVTLIGHSLGGGVTLLTALDLVGRAPARLERMVIVAGAAYDQRMPPFVRLADFPRLSTMAFNAVGAERVVRVVLEQIVHDPGRVEEDQVRGYAAPLASSDAVRCLIASAQQIRPDDLDAIVARYPALDVPALLLWGRHDRVVPLAVGERLARDLPRARLVVLERCGHLPAEELPEASYAVLERFLDHSATR